MNPKPLLALNHFTVPCSFNLFLFPSYLVPFPTASSKKRDRKCGLAVPSTILKDLQEQQTRRNLLMFMSALSMQFPLRFPNCSLCGTLRADSQCVQRYFESRADRVALVVTFVRLIPQTHDGLRDLRPVTSSLLGILFVTTAAKGAILPLRLIVRLCCAVPLVQN
jgi:hypothetical protein